MVWRPQVVAKIIDFDAYKTRKPSAPVAPSAQFSNAFGAMANSTVECRYDLNKGKVISLAIESR